MTIRDYDEIIGLWRRTPGMGLSQADSRESIQRFLKRNPKMSFVCKQGGQIVATILCGHDARRGYLYHLAVDEKFRKQGIGRHLTQLSLKELHRLGIAKCHLFVYRDNKPAELFYRREGWQERTTLNIFSKDI